jgi:NADH-quinone oxidoreductase subunit N
MPPTVGFMGKLFVFNAALMQQFYGLVLVGAIGSAIALFFYLRVIVKMYMTKPVPGFGVTVIPRSSIPILGIFIFAAFCIVLIGTVLPEASLKYLAPVVKELLVVN